uniref:Uncharacterized protein n=1 Tax=Tetradesmus obliquus TaxID=3088 RepID=A0A383WEY2_TETOB|eukprot:jgi/Sobl393_1/1882/SZX75296.1
MVNTPFNNFLVMGDPGLRAKFQEAFTRTTDPGAHGTYFWPVESAWASITRQLCMSLQQLQDTLAAAPDIAMQYMYINAVNGTTIMSSDFKDGMSLQTMDPGFALQLRKRTVNGSAQW